MTETIVVAGALAQRPYHGGHTWVFLQWLLGFKRLGWDVHFVDRLDEDMCVDERGAPTSFSRSYNVRYLERVMTAFGLEASWTLLHDSGAAGRSRADAIDAARRSALLLNVMGYLDDEDILGAASLRVFLDIDPGFGQMWQSLGLATPFSGHDRYVTVGTNVGTIRSAIPDCGLEWIPTLPPVELHEWPPADEPAAAFTSVASWRGPFGPLEYLGNTYGLRVHEFRRFFELAERTGASFELALDIDEADQHDLRELQRHGWRVTDPIAAAGDPWRYRDYVRRSAAELMIAKNLYVATRSGWFSDRSACYLASGRPVLAQDTGLEQLPRQEGLVLFETLDEAVAGVESILARPLRHRHAARDLAEQHFAAGRVLTQLLAKLGVA